MTIKTISRLTSWVTPSQADADLWRSLSREQQLANLKELANHPDTTTHTDITMTDIMEEIRIRRAKNDPAL